MHEAAFCSGVNKGIAPWGQWPQKSLLHRQVPTAQQKENRVTVTTDLFVTRKSRALRSLTGERALFE
jgi:hypothetical protein